MIIKRKKYSLINNVKRHSQATGATMYFYNSMISNVNNNYFAKKYKRCIFLLTNEIMMNHKCKNSLKKCYLYDNSNLIIKLYVIS